MGAPKTITAASPKGGPGKTTTLTALAIALARAGNKTLCIDLDNIGSLTNNLQGVSIRKPEFSNVTALFEDSNSEIIPAEITKNLFLLQGDEQISEINRIGSMQVIGNMEAAITDRIKDIESYDYILIDTPAGDGNTVAASLIFSDYVYSAITLDQNSLSALASLSKMIKPIRKRMNPKIKHIGFVVNQVHGIVNSDGKPLPETKSERKIYNELMSSTPDSYLLGMIGFRNVIQKMISQGQWVSGNSPSEKMADKELTTFYKNVLEETK